MSNILAIAGKELRSYFASPIAYIVIGFFALVYGYFYWIMLAYFVQISGQMSPMGPQAININEHMIRPLLQNVTVVILFVMPMITMRAYAEEKRSGTIELLLTSPVTDLQIILGKFLGALALWAIMLLVTVIHIGMLFIYGSPEWKPLITAYLGLLLLGGCFISVGLFISSLTRNQIVAAMATFAVFLLFWVISWISSIAGGAWYGDAASFASIVDHFDDFAKGVLDTKHAIYYVSFIAFGLYLTAKSVDTERWRA
ncbi:MAG: ABC transporter [Acidimicrobiia bacterium]|nr:ABC transporter [Acidimicrobiia bacterium]